jgi:phage-related protein
MYEAKIENSGGEILSLTGDEKKWQLFDVGGLDPPKATVNLTNLAGMDGARFNSSKVNTRNLVISLKINGDVEANRLELYRFFRPKHGCTFYFKNKRRDVKIDGVVESVECPQFTNMEIMQVSILCPFPYFRALTEVIVSISKEIAGFRFPFSINVGDPVSFSMYDEQREAAVTNSSDVETGAVITVNFSGAVSRILIGCADTGDTMMVDYSFRIGDRLVIDTNRGQKSIQLLRSGATYNLFSAMQRGSVFFTLPPGDSHFYYSADGGASDHDVLIVFTMQNLYAGV